MQFKKDEKTKVLEEEWGKWRCTKTGSEGRGWGTLTVQLV